MDSIENILILYKQSSNLLNNLQVKKNLLGHHGELEVLEYYVHKAFAN